MDKKSTNSFFIANQSQGDKSMANDKSTISFLKAKVESEPKVAKSMATPNILASMMRKNLIAKVEEKEEEAQV